MAQPGTLGRSLKLADYQQYFVNDDNRDRHANFAARNNTAFPQIVIHRQPELLNTQIAELMQEVWSSARPC